MRRRGTGGGSRRGGERVVEGRGTGLDFGGGAALQAGYRVAGVRIAGWAWIRKPNNATITEAGNARLTFRNTIAPVC